MAPPTEDYAIRREDLPVILEQYDLLAQEMIRREKEGRGFQFFHFMIDLTGGPCVYKRLSGCGSGTEYLAVTPWGDLYPCHQFVGEEKFLLGNVEEGESSGRTSAGNLKNATCTPKRNVRRVLRPVLLQRRLRGQFLQLHRKDRRRLRDRLRHAEKEDRVRPDDQGGAGIGKKAEVP